jgi:hypothetical protein
MRIHAARVLRTAILSSLAAVALVSSANAGTLALTFADRSVTVSGATAGGNVAFFAIAKEGSESVPRIPLKTRHAVVLNDDDRDGKVVFERSRSLPLIAIWVAVDIESGQWAASGSPGFDADTIPLQELAKHDNAGQLRKLSADVPEMDVLLVRPGAGAWQLSAAKTSKVDENGRDDRALRLDVGEMMPLTKSQPKLNSLHPGDVLAVIEPRSMRFAVVEVGR